MYKLLLILNLCVVCIVMYALQTDEALSLQMYFQSKHSINRAVHAAAQQLDMDKLSQGIFEIDEASAKRVAWMYLRQNLNLDQGLSPLPGSMLTKPAEIVQFQVINEGEIFPYTFYDAKLGYSIVLNNPSVIMIMRLEYPRLYSILPPLTWHIKGVAEIVN